MVYELLLCVILGMLIITCISPLEVRTDRLVQQLPRTSRHADAAPWIQRDFYNLWGHRQREWFGLNDPDNRSIATIVADLPPVTLYWIEPDLTVHWSALWSQPFTSSPW
jgi:hypothetical protein